MATTLQNLSEQDVENIYLFIGDSIRSDAIPKRIESVGVSAPCIAPSTWTAASMPAILTGLYPATVGISDFGAKLPSPSPLFDQPHTASLSAPTIWTDTDPGEKPPQQLIHAEDYRPLRELEPPFIHIEHHKGGHAPYGHTFEECASEDALFSEKGASLTDVPRLYDNSVHDAASRFEEQCDYLESEGLLENTLVIFTSDHGELLGRQSEARLLGHTQPLVPAVVSVPLVFSGVGLPDISLSNIYSGVDIVPTICGALDDAETPTSDGIDFWNNSSSDSRCVRCEVTRHRCFGPMEREICIYQARSLWDRTGGRVVQDGSRIIRGGVGALSQYAKGAAQRETARSLSPVALWRFANWYGSRRRTHGSPAFDWSTAIRELPKDFAGEDIEYNQDHLEKQLEDLGYL